MVLLCWLYLFYPSLCCGSSYSIDLGGCIENTEMLNNPFHQWFARWRKLCSYWPSDTPCGRAVTRFPGTRQEEEKQNKPERAVTARGLHWKGGLIISNRGKYRTSNTKKGVCVGVLKVSRTIIYPFCGTLLRSVTVFRGGGGLALKLTVGWLLLCIELQLGWGRGRMEAILSCELRVKREQDS